MNTTTRPIFSHKRIALVAHDSCKQNLLNWVKKHKEALAPHQLYATGTTGHLLSRETGLENSLAIKWPDGRRSTTWWTDCREKN